MALQKEELLLGQFAFFTDVSGKEHPVILSKVGTVFCEICFLLTGEFKSLPFDHYANERGLVKCLSGVEISQIESFLRRLSEKHRKEREGLEGYKWGLELKSEVLIAKLAESQLLAADIVNDAKDLVADKAEFEAKLLNLVDRMNVVTNLLIVLNTVKEFDGRDAIRIRSKAHLKSFLEMICKSGG